MWFYINSQIKISFHIQQKIIFYLKTVWFKKNNSKTQQEYKTALTRWVQITYEALNEWKSNLVGNLKIRVNETLLLLF